MKKQYLYFTIDQLLDNQLHIGHKTQNWNSLISKYIFGFRKHICLFNLKKTLFFIRRAMFFLENAIFFYGKLFFIGVHPEKEFLIKLFSVENNTPFIIRDWVQGTFTNWHFIYKFFTILRNPKINIMKKHVFKTRKKKLQKVVQYIQLLKRLEGLKTAKCLPELVIILGCLESKLSLKEALSLMIPTITLVDSNIIPKNVPYPIPGNDDALESLLFFCNIIRYAIKQGLAKRKIYFLTRFPKNQTYQNEK